MIAYMQSIFIKGIKAMEEIDFATRAILGGLTLGLIFGAATMVSKFCLRTMMITNNAEERAKQTRLWVISVTLSLIGIQALIHFYGLDLEGSIYRTEILAPIGLLIGGLLFGSGMVLARGCLARHLVLGGTGNIRSWVVLLVAGLSAYATARGIFAYARLSVEDSWQILHDPELYRNWIGMFLLAALGFVLFRARKSLFHGKDRLKDIIAAILIAGAVIGGFYVTAFYGFDEFDPQPVTSLRFTLPIGDSLVYLITHTGASASFPIAVIGGVFIGSLVSALSTRQFVWQSFEDVRSTLRYLIAAVMMGVGGIMALGCTIGQGLVGLSTLSTSAPLAVIGIYAGARITIRYIRFENSKLEITALKTSVA